MANEEIESVRGIPDDFLRRLTADRGVFDGTYHVDVEVGEALLECHIPVQIDTHSFSVGCIWPVEDDVESLERSVARFIADFPRDRIVKRDSVFFTAIRLECFRLRWGWKSRRGTVRECESGQGDENRSNVH